MVMTVHAPVPDWPGSLTHTDFMEATLDPVLSEELSGRRPRSDAVTLASRQASAELPRPWHNQRDD